MPQTDAALNIMKLDGNAEIPPAPSVTAAVTRLAETRPDQPAYTFVDYSADLAGTPVSLTWRDLDARARAIAAELRGQVEPGSGPRFSPRRDSDMSPRCSVPSTPT